MADTDAPAKIGKFILNWRNNFYIAVDGETDVDNYNKA